MNLKVAHKLMLMVLLIAVGCVGLVTIFERHCISACFATYVTRGELTEVHNLAQLLEQEYAKEGSWNFVEEDRDAMWWLILRSEAMRHHEMEQGPAKLPHFPGIGGPHPNGWVGFDPTPPLLPLEELVKNNGPIPKPKDNRHPDEQLPDASPGPWGVPGPSQPDRIPGRRVSLPFPLPQHRMQLLSRLALLDQSGRLVWGNPTAATSNGIIELRHNGRSIGTLRLKANEQLSRDMESDFLSQQTTGQLVLYALAGIVLAVVAAALLSRHLDEALRTLLEGTRKLVSGNLQSRIKLERSDELGQLASDLNTLAQTLEQQDRAHKQWVTDTSHELRTPIAVLRAQVEALQDGVREPNQRTFELLHSQIMTLSKFVDDLYDLAKFDMGELKYDLVPVDIMPLLEELSGAFSERFGSKSIKLDMSSLSHDQHCIVNADVVRLRQLFSNLLENSLRYTDSGGTARVSMKVEQGTVILSFDDTPPGIPADLLPRVFERFFRVDSSRSRALGGAGIGLSICLAIVSAHGGHIQAGTSQLGGLQMCVTLPLIKGTGVA